MSVSPLSSNSYTSSILQRSLRVNQLLINRTLERLSTNLRINRAADDPLGITIASRYKTQLYGNRQASSNSQQAIGLTDQAADGVQSVMSNLNKIRELVVKSLSDTSSDTDRRRIQTEIDSLVLDTDRIARNTIFNSRNLLDGSLSDMILPRGASAEIESNATLLDSTGNSFEFLTSNPTVGSGASNFDLVQFRVFDNGSGGYGLEISTANSGVVMNYNDITTAPTSVNVPVSGATSSFSLASITGSGGTSGPLTTTELNTDLASLVASGRIDPVTYGQFDITLGGNLYDDFYDVQGTSSINDVLNAINGVDPLNVSASYDTGTGRINVQYSGQVSVATTRTSAYSTGGTPVAAGNVADMTALNPAAQGPNYRDIDSFLPTGSFDPDSLPMGKYFVNSSDIPLDTSVSYTNSSTNLLNFFGLSNTTNNYQITDYSKEYYGDVLAVGSDYTNRTRVVITDVTGEQSQTGSDTGLDETAGDLTRSLGELSSPSVTLSSGGGGNSIPAGAFTIDFGSNGVFSYNFDPDTDSIQDIVDAINNYAGEPLGGSVSASFDTSTGKISISNTPPSSSGSYTKITNSGGFTNNGVIKVDVDGDGKDDFDMNKPGTLTIQGFLDAFNSAYNLFFDPKDNDPDVVAATFTVDSPTDPGYPVAGADGFTFTNPLSPGSNINFDGPNGPGFVSLFQLNSGSPTVTSQADIDNGAIDPSLDVTSTDVKFTTIADLISKSYSVPGNNQILLQDGAGTQNTTTQGLADFFNLNNVSNSGSGTAQSSISVADIDNGATYAGLNITDAGASTFTELLTATSPTLQGLSGLIGNELWIDNSKLITVGASTTIQNIIDAVNNYNTGPSNKDYEATFANWSLSIKVIDNENLTDPVSQAATNPGGAAPTVNDNTLTLDTSAYTFTSNPAPTNFGPSSTAPGVGDTPYLFTTPTAPGDISSISFGGATNIASVLLLNNAASASVSGPTTVSDLYEGSFSGSDPSYTLTGTQTRVFGAVSASTSTGAIGNSTGSGGGIDPSSLPADGVVARVSIFPSIAGSFVDKGIVFQVGGNEGNTMRFNLNELTAESLNIENLRTYRDGDSDVLARLRGENALRIIDNALEASQDVLNQVGIFGRILEGNVDYLENSQINLSKSLSDLQDADIDEELSNLTKAQANMQVASALLAQNNSNTLSLYSILFGNSGGGFGF